MSSETQLHILQQQLTLQRFPIRAKETLRAWDAADEYLLQEIHPELNTNTRILIANDTFGTLATTLSEFKPDCVSDSFISQLSTRENLTRNGKDPEQAKLYNSLQWPEGDFDIVLMKLPKSHALLEDQLHQLKTKLKPGGKIVAAAMAKHIHSTTLKLFEKIIGPTHTSLAKKKARLIHTRSDGKAATLSPYPKRYVNSEYQLEISNHSGVFSQAKLDIGTEFFLAHIPAHERYKTIIDLGCGNGLLGLRAAQSNPHANIVFCDESHMAVESSRENMGLNFKQEKRAEFFQSDCLDNENIPTADLILNNPPFHQQHAIGDHIARRMFRQAFKKLNLDGELWVVGNRHLGYHKLLKDLFGNCELIASNSRFVILRARKSR